MQVPEKLTLIGGSILLASTLVFTLKSQASRILPRINGSSSHIYSHIGDAQKASDFDYGYHEAQKNGWQTGTWGTAPFYVDDNKDVYIGGGKPQGVLQIMLGNDTGSKVQSVNFTKDVQFPQNSQEMLRWLSEVKHINGLDHVDTSRTNNISYMFRDDYALQSIDISSWHTKPIVSSRNMFWYDHALQDIDLSGPDLSQVNDQYYMFMQNDSLKRITLGKRTAIQKNDGGQNIGPSWSIGANFDAGNWKNGNQTVPANQLADEHIHPGTWVKQ